MDGFSTLFLGLIAGAGLGVLFHRWMSRQRISDAYQRGQDQMRVEVATLETRLEGEQAQHEQALLAQSQKHEEKLAVLRDAKKEMTLVFQNLANTILEKKTEKFTEINQTNMDAILKPLKEQIHKFEKQVQSTYEKDTKERTLLGKEIENLKTLNARISEDAVNLTQALTGQVKSQGIWGELILERVLEMSGLKKGSEYDVQVHTTAEDGRRFHPDVVVHLPQGREVVVDSKVSLTAYESYCSATDDGEREIALKQLTQSIKSHIKELSGKNYQSLYELHSLDYVLMFIPVEPAFTLATQSDKSLYDLSLKQNIVIVTPSTLLATLRTIENLWRMERQGQNAQEIAQRAGQLYDKFVLFVDDLKDVGKRIEQTQTAYDGALNKLSTGRGNIVRRAEQIKALGARTSKTLPKELIDGSEPEAPLIEWVADAKITED